MNRLFRFCSLAAIAPVLLASCYYYSTIRISQRITVAAGDTGAAAVAGGESESPPRYHAVKTERYLARTTSSGPASHINARGVAFAVEGQFNEAAILFRESLREEPDYPAALNNLGVVYELFGMREKSFEHYSRACLLDPDNDRFRANFLYVADGAPRKEAAPEKPAGSPAGRGK